MSRIGVLYFSREKTPYLSLKWLLPLVAVILQSKNCDGTSSDLDLKISLTPQENIVAGDILTYSIAIEHSSKSLADAFDVDLQLRTPFYIHLDAPGVDSTRQPDEIIRNTTDLLLKFANISRAENAVILNMDVHVDPYYMLGSREQETAIIFSQLWYYDDDNDTCARPENKWDARSLLENTRFSFTADKVCERAIDVEESQYTASSFEKTHANILGSSPHRAMFSNSGSWQPAIAKREDVRQFLQIELKQLSRVTKIGTKGDGQKCYVKQYGVFYSKDFLHWYKGLSQSESEVFQGNSDAVSVSYAFLRVPVRARVLRIVPKEWKGVAALKVAIHGCTVYNIADGFEPMGISSGKVKNNQLSVTFGDTSTYPPRNARLNFHQLPGGWCTSRHSKQTLVIDLVTDHVITEFAMQSVFEATGKTVKSFYLSYKKNGGSKTYYPDSRKKLFFGNPIEDTTIRHKLLKFITAQHLYIEPRDIPGAHGCIRVEFYGYEEAKVPDEDYISILDFENAGIVNWEREGSVFDLQPTFYDNLYARTGFPANMEGDWWIATRENRRTANSIPGLVNKNASIGTLTSPPFLIPSTKLMFMFSGSSNVTTRAELLVDGAVVRTVSGSGNEPMVLVTWDVTELVSKEATMRLVQDDNTGFLNFDGLKASSFPVTEKYPVFERSMLVNPITNVLYICQHSHDSEPRGPVCLFTADNGKSWRGTSRTVGGLVGLNKDSGKIFGVSTDGRSFIQSNDWTGKSWVQVTGDFSTTIAGEAAFVQALEIPYLPITGLTQTDSPSDVLRITTNAGHSFAASAVGVHHKPPGGSWSKILTWYYPEKLSNACLSYPCENDANCTATETGFNCSCKTGFQGERCETDADDCQAAPCQNGGQCIDDINKYFCLCDKRFTGKNCETEIVHCAMSCDNGGTCVDNGGLYSCNCPQGFVGTRCEIETDECASLPCQNGGLCIDGLNTYSCHCRENYYGVNCEQVTTSAFEVLDTSSYHHIVTSQTYLVVHARIPEDGRSILPTWCHEYEALCRSLGKRRPTGCGRSSNHISAAEQCLAKYDSVMAREDTLGCPPNLNVAVIAKLAGYNKATASNSFGFHHCQDNNCTNVLSSSGCHGALSCINRAVKDREVYTLCSDPDSNFVVQDKKPIIVDGVDFLAMYVKPMSSESRHDSWCEDYQYLCESYGKHPVQCHSEPQTIPSQCNKDYFAVMSTHVGCDGLQVSDIGKKAGLPQTTAQFVFKNCSSGLCSKSLPSCLSLDCLNNSDTYYHALCTELKTSFTVLDTKATTIDGAVALAFQTRIPHDRRSTQSTWCMDYKTLCNAYGFHPLGCGITQDERYSSCRGDYNSLNIWADPNSCYPELEVANLAKTAGFTNAAASNSFALHKCTECSSFLPFDDCADKGVGCLTSNVVYTACSKANPALDVVQTGTTTYNGNGFLAMKVNPRTLNMASVYDDLCAKYGYRTIKCTTTPISPSPIPSHTSNCPPQTRSQVAFESKCDDNVQQAILKKAGVLDSSHPGLISFASQPYTTTDVDTAYAICHGHHSNFDVVSTVTAQHDGMEYLVIQAWLPTHGVSRMKNWCEDYKSLCLSYGYRPTGCEDMAASDTAYSDCRNTYQSYITTNHSLTCPLSDSISFLADQAGYIDANNTFAFTFCNNTTCVKNLTATDGFISDVDICKPVYTVCIKPNISLVAEETQNIQTAEGFKYTAVKAGVSSGATCSDYRALCGSHSLTLDTSEAALGLKVSKYIGNNEHPWLYKQDTFITQGNCHMTGDLTNDDAVFVLCTASADSTFNVHDKKSVNYNNQRYVVFRTSVPAHGQSRHNNWCQDYSKLCAANELRPVSFTHLNPLQKTKCIHDYDVAVATVAVDATVLAKMAGFPEATASITFTFSSCDDDDCPRTLSNQCSDGLNCLSNVHSEYYTVCTDWDSNMVVQLRSFGHLHGVQSLVTLNTRSLLTNDLAKYGTWCEDYYHACGSFNLQPMWCNISDPVLDSKCCDANHEQFVTTDVISSDVTKSFQCMPLPSSFDVVEAKEALFGKINISVIEVQLKENHSSDWCDDYNSMCESIGQRPVLCPLWGDPTTYRHREDYNFYLLNDACPSKEIITNLTQDLFSGVDDENVIELLSSSSHVDKCGQSITNVSAFTHNFSTPFYTFCAKPADSSFIVKESREVADDKRTYTVVRASVHASGISFKGWCEDFKSLCHSFGKRPVGCGKDAVVAKNSRDCRVLYDAVMLNDFSCPANDKLFHIVTKSGFTTTKNQTLGLWECTECGSTFNDVWQDANIMSDIYAVCSDSDSNFKVLEKQIVPHRGAYVPVIMAEIPADGLSLHENWCQDYSMLCQSYGSRPVGCPKAMDNVEEHAHCREEYDALMFSDAAFQCSDTANTHIVVRSAGFADANADNTIAFRSCSPHHCTKSLYTSKAFGKFNFNPNNRVVYTVCASSDSAYDVLATKSITVTDQDYMVVEAKIPAHGLSKYSTWCDDYQKLCEGYMMHPLTCKTGSDEQQLCTYNYDPINVVEPSACRDVVFSIAQAAGFQDSSVNTSFAMDDCARDSCSNKAPNQHCSQVNKYYNNVPYVANITQVDQKKEYCLILPSVDPPLMFEGIQLDVHFKDSLCNLSVLDLSEKNLKISYYNMSVYQDNVLRVETECHLLSGSSLARVSGEVTTVCMRPSVGMNFRVAGTRKVTSFGREYLVVKANMLSSKSKSQSWCQDYKNLCQTLRSSPLACPRQYSYEPGYGKCASGYEAILLTNINHGCPSNDFVSRLAQSAGYKESSQFNTFSLYDCNDCTSTLPDTGCSKSLHCLNADNIARPVYTACLVSNSDSNFHVNEKKQYLDGTYGMQYTAVRARILDPKSLHDSWCTDYQRLCESLDMKPVLRGASDACKEKYNAIVTTRWARFVAASAGFTEAKTFNSILFKSCDSCSDTLTSIIDNSLDRLRWPMVNNELYTVCAVNTRLGFTPMATRHVRHGGYVFRVIQASLKGPASPYHRDWARDYKDLCASYNELPTGCGEPSADNHTTNCHTWYDSYLLPGDELQCNPNDIIAKLAKEVGFAGASPSNSFGFATCNGTLETLSTNCSEGLPCLRYDQNNRIVYTVCVSPKRSHNFEVLSTKTKAGYLVVKSRLPTDGRSRQANWCGDYQKLCETYQMRPTGCGAAAMQIPAYAECATSYNSYMSADDQLGCDDTTVASAISKSAGYIKASPTNTFVFHSCNNCPSVLDTAKCDSALGCVSTELSDREVYTLCVDPATNFNVVKTSHVEFSGVNYLVIEAKLASHGLSKTESWCRDYEKLCGQYGRLPVACERNEEKYGCLQQYGATFQEGIPCNTASTTAANIAKQAGFSAATPNSAFVFKKCNAQSCSKYLPAQCDQGLSCLKSASVGKNVYAICLADQPIFQITDTKRVSIPGVVLTVVSARFAYDWVSNTWCSDYTKLCHAIGQSPVILPSEIETAERRNCHAQYDGVILPSEMTSYFSDGVHLLATKAGFANAKYGNTFAFKACSNTGCSEYPSGQNCSDSLHCLNGATQARTVYGLCVENIAAVSNFLVLDSSPVGPKHNGYFMLKVRIPLHRQSKLESWCRDYQRLCSAYDMRPVSHIDNPACFSKYNTVYHNGGDTTLVELVKQSGYQSASVDNVFVLEACDDNECTREMPQCATGTCQIITREFYLACSYIT